MPGDEDAPPGEDIPAVPEKPAVQPQVPAGFWTDLMAAARKELKPPASGFFVASPNAPVQGALVGNKLELRCANTFVAETVGRPDILEVMTRNASAMLGRPVQAVAVDLSAKPKNNPRMEQLMNFGKAHSDIVKIKNQ